MRCSKCGADKDPSGFYRDAQKSSGVRPDCKACSNARVADWGERNRERRKAWETAYRAANAARAAVYRRAWLKTAHDHREKRRGYLRAYRACLGRSTTVTTAEWLERIQEFNGCCAYCLRPLSEACTLDHFRPVSRDGPHALENAVPACGSCNSRKSDGLIFDWLTRGVGVSGS